MKRYKIRKGSLLDILPAILAFIALILAMGIGQTLIDGGAV
ncbi:MAG: hypothetical protein ACOYI4_09540 [Christensenellales bacterium]|jgi:hypothetical protein